MTNKPKTAIIQTNSIPTPLTQEFSRIIRRYKKHCIYIKRLLEETDRSYNEIYEKRVLTPGVLNFFY